MHQIKHARDQELQKYQTDYASEDQRVSRAAKEKSSEIKQAYDCLASDKKFNDYLEKCNKLIIEGKTTKEKLLLDFESKEKNRPNLVLVEDLPVINPIVEDSNVISGPSPGAPIPVEPQSDDTEFSGTIFTKEEEEKEINDLKEKQLEKERKYEKRKKSRLDSISNKAILEIKNVAIKEAARVARDIKREGEELAPDDFFDEVKIEADRKVEKLKDEYIEKMIRLDLEPDEELKNQLNEIARQSTEDAASQELLFYKNKSKLQTGKPNLLYVAIAVVTSLALFLFFINTAKLMWDKLPDPTGNQFKSATKPAVETINANPVDPNLKVSSVLAIAKAQDLAPTAGIAGMAGFANNLDIEGAADYNQALHKAYKRDYAAAVDQFNLSFNKNEHLFQTQYNLASMYFWMGKNDEAITHFSNSLNIRPDLSQANYNKGVIMLNRARTINQQLTGMSTEQTNELKILNDSTRLIHSSIKEFNKAIKNAPLLAQPIYNRGVARYMLGDLKGSKADFVEALRLDSMMDAASFNMATVANQLEPEKRQSKIKNRNLPQGPEGPQGPPGPGLL